MKVDKITVYVYEDGYEIEAGLLINDTCPIHIIERYAEDSLLFEKELSDIFDDSYLYVAIYQNTETNEVCSTCSILETWEDIYWKPEVDHIKWRMKYE